MAPVPEPKGLVAEFYVSTPAATWKQARDAAGIALLPRNYGVLLTTVLGLPPIVADAFDESATTTGAAVLDDKSEWQAVVGAKLSSGRELIARLTTGGKAAYDERKDPSGIVYLQPKPGKASTEIALAVLGNRLLVARDAAAIGLVGPYVAKTLPTKKPPGPGVVMHVPKKALSGPLAAELKKRWKTLKTDLTKRDQANRKKHGGRAPDFGDPQAAMSVMASNVAGWVEMLEHAERAQLRLLSEKDALRLRLEVDPGKKSELKDWVRGLAVGDASPLLHLPQGAAVGVIARSSPEQRRASAKSTAASLAKMFGDRLKPAQQERVEKALAELAESRGDEALFGFVRAPTAGLVYRGTSADQKRFDAATKNLVGLLRLNAFKEPINQFVGAFTVKHSTTKIVGLENKAHRVLFTIKPSGMRMAKDPKGQVSAAPQPIELLWTESGGITYGAMTQDAPPLLIAMVATEPAKSWAGLPQVGTRLKKIGKGASFVVAARPQILLGNAPANSAGLATVAVGRESGLGVMNLTVDRAALGFFVQRAMTQ